MAKVRPVALFELVSVKESMLGSITPLEWALSVTIQDAEDYHAQMKKAGITIHRRDRVKVYQFAFLYSPYDLEALNLMEEDSSSS